MAVERVSEFKINGNGQAHGRYPYASEREKEGEQQWQQQEICYRGVSQDWIAQLNYSVGWVGSPDVGACGPNQFHTNCCDQILLGIRGTLIGFMSVYLVSGAFNHFIRATKTSLN